MSKWQHISKFKGKTYDGHYHVDEKTNERIFVLSGKRADKKPHNIAFESPEAAKATGWKKIE